ncbi:hypothetical protein KKA95_05035 [Patescibacteria group bacterium]|nr:hypothetical protein [Patescibacteria group bacterium]
MEEETTTPQEENVETQHVASKTDDDVEKKEEPKKEEEIQEMTTLHERTIAALSYVGFLAIVPFYLKKDSKFCRFHGKQGLLVAMIFFFAKLLLVIDLLMDLALIMQFAIFLWMGFAALSGKWKKMPWIYNKSCQLEDQLSLKTKEEEAEEAGLKPGEVKSNEDE